MTLSITAFNWLQAPDYWLSRLVISRGMGAIYLIAFLVAFNQFPALLGERGLLPAPDFIRQIPFDRIPSLFHLRYSDRLLRAAATIGIVLSVAIVLGIVDAAPVLVWMLVWLVLWVLYLSIANIGQIFYGFGWESLLLEAGFLAIFLGPSSVAPPIVVIWMFRWLVLSGNFSWLNWITIVCAVSALDNAALSWLLPIHSPALAPQPIWFQVVLLALTLFILVLSYAPARNLLSRRQLMNFSFNPFHLVNAYGAFGSITRVRYEIVVEGAAASDLTAGGTAWSEYEFKGKPGDPRRLPPQVAPYHLRLDWLMWFAAMSSPVDHPWFVPFLIKLLQNDSATLKLLRRNPFPHGPPAFVRARLYRYRFSTARERRQTGQWWMRDLVGDYVPPVRLAGRDQKAAER